MKAPRIARANENRTDRFGGPFFLSIHIVREINIYPQSGWFFIIKIRLSAA